MKHLFLALMLAISFIANSQVNGDLYFMGEGDGLFAFILNEPQDSFYHVFNSDFGSRDELGSYLVNLTYGFDVVDGPWSLTLPSSGAMVSGELFLTIDETYVIFDFYVDEIKYPDGTLYHRGTFLKPVRNLNKF
jgi:hypothetical protein